MTRSIIKLCSILLFLAVSSNGWAVQSVSVSPSKQTISTASSTISITWTIKGTAPTASTAFSNNGFFIGPDGSTLGTTGFTETTSSCLVTDCTLAESVTIPASVISQALAKGWSYFNYQRTFEQPTGTSSAAVNLVLIGAAGTFNISRIGLRFNDYARVKVVSANRPLRVMADISYTGSGTFKAQWEIAEPPSTSGSPMFRNFRTVREQFSGTGRTTLLSPPLPTHHPGKYLVRLTVTDPTLVFTTPEIRYNVGDSTRRQYRRPPLALLKPISVIAPAPGANIQQKTEIQWRALNGAAKAYRVEVFALGEKPLPAPGQTIVSPNHRVMVTGIMVKSDIRKTELSSLVRSHLKAGHSYQWRVVAIDGKGEAIGVSATSLFHVD